MIRVLVADEYNLFRKGLLTLLEEENNIIVVGEAENGNDLVEKYKQTKPDLIISDISMPIKSGITAIKKIRRSNKQVKVLFISQYSGDDYIYSVFNVGAQGLLSKSNNIKDLMFAIKEIMQGRYYFMGKSKNELEAIINRFTLRKMLKVDDENNKPTKREEEVLLLISESMTTADIANKLHLSHRTIESHRSNIIKKFKLKSLLGLINYSREYARKVKTEQEIW